MVAWAAGESVEAGRAPKWLTGAAALVILGACAAQTRHQLHYWRNSESLFRHTVAATDNNVVALNNHGYAVGDTVVFDVSTTLGRCHSFWLLHGSNCD
jgi:hypothetical protein